MKWISMSGKAERIASLSGHIIFVPPDEFVELLPHMEPEARMLGCISEEIHAKITGGMGGVKAPISDVERSATICLRLKEMVAGGDASHFTKAGIPNKTALDGLCGFPTTKKELTDCWKTVSDELDAADREKAQAAMLAELQEKAQATGGKVDLDDDTDDTKQDKDKE